VLLSAAKMTLSLLEKQYWWKNQRFIDVDSERSIQTDFVRLGISMGRFAPQEYFLAQLKLSSGRGCFIVCPNARKFRH